MMQNGKGAVKKILIVNTTFNKGGAAKIARQLFDSIQESAGFDIHFVYGRGRKIKTENVRKVSYNIEICLHLLITRMSGFHGCGTFFSTRKLENFIKKSHFDLIHLHNIHGYYIDLSLIQFLKMLDIPLIWTFHDVWPFTGNCVFFFDCEEWHNECGRCPYNKFYPKSHINSSKKNAPCKKRFIFKGMESSDCSPIQLAEGKNRRILLKKC